MSVCKIAVALGEFSNLGYWDRVGGRTGRNITLAHLTWTFGSLASAFIMSGAHTVISSYSNNLH